MTRGMTAGEAIMKPLESVTCHVEKEGGPTKRVYDDGIVLVMQDSTWHGAVRHVDSVGGRFYDS